MYSAIRFSVVDSATTLLASRSWVRNFAAPKKSISLLQSKQTPAWPTEMFIDQCRDSFPRVKLPASEADSSSLPRLRMRGAKPPPLYILFFMYFFYR